MLRREVDYIALSTGNWFVTSLEQQNRRLQSLEGAERPTSSQLASSWPSPDRAVGGSDNLGVPSSNVVGII